MQTPAACRALSTTLVGEIRGGEGAASRTVALTGGIVSSRGRCGSGARAVAPDCSTSQAGGSLGRTELSRAYATKTSTVWLAADLSSTFRSSAECRLLLVSSIRCYYCYSRILYIYYRIRSFYLARFCMPNLAQRIIIDT